MFRNPFTRAAFAFVLTFGGAAEREAHAQSCCAGSSAITPARLALHEDALVGVQLKAATLTGSFDDGAHYRKLSAGSAELDFEESLMGAVRLGGRGQVSLFVPFEQTWRKAGDQSEFGKGLGDINVGGRYDFTLAGQSSIVPGIALLTGLTLPTGTAPEAAHTPLATDATGIGAFQFNLGGAVEQTFGPWLINAAAFVALRTSRSIDGVDTTLGPQLTTLAAVAYSFPNDAAIAVVGSYTLEGSAHVDGQEAPSSARHLGVLSLSGLLPLTDAWRLQGSLFTNPPLSPFGRNQPASTGITFGILRSWS